MPLPSPLPLPCLCPCLGKVGDRAQGEQGGGRSTPVRKYGDGCGRGSRGELAKRGGGDAGASSRRNDKEIARDPRVPEGLRARPQVPAASEQGGPLGFQGPAAASKRPQHTLPYSWIGVVRQICKAWCRERKVLLSFELPRSGLPGLRRERRAGWLDNAPVVVYVRGRRSSHAFST